MAKYFNITRNDLKYLINEVCRKMSLLNESVKEGGKAGHMFHPFEVNEYTFGTFKELVQDLFNTNIEKFTEKLDGMNIFATVDQNGTVRFARNTSDTKNEFGGMDLAGIQARWGERDDPTIFEAYNNAYNLFNDVVNKIQDPVNFFNGEGYRIYANCEVIDPVHSNVIPYLNKGKTLSFHGLVALTTDGTAKEANVPDEMFDQKMAVLEKLLPDVKSNYGEAQVTPEVIIKIREDCESAIRDYIAQIDRIEEMAGVGDDTTIIEYRAKLLPRWLADHGFEILVNNQFSEYFFKRWIYEVKEPTLTQYKKIMKESGVANWEEIYNATRIFEGGFKKGSPWKNAMEEIMEPVENFFYSLGNEVLKGVQDYSNVGKVAEVMDAYARQLQATQEMLQATGDLEYQQDMAKYLRKLAALGNKYNPMEGVVFSYKGKTLKLTGSFAALNRAINIRLQLAKKYKNQA